MVSGISCEIGWRRVREVGVTPPLQTQLPSYVSVIRIKLPKTTLTLSLSSSKSPILLNNIISIYNLMKKLHDWHQEFRLLPLLRHRRGRRNVHHQIRLPPKMAPGILPIIEYNYTTERKNNFAFLLRFSSSLRVSCLMLCVGLVLSSVADPEPNPDPDPHVFGPPGSGSGSFYH